MPRLLFKVSYVVAIAGRSGVYLFPGIAPEGKESFRIGDHLLLRRPDGSELDVAIDSFEVATPNPEHRVIVGLQTLSKTDVPIETEVWSFDTSASR
jgi:hypothetical protein